MTTISMTYQTFEKMLWPSWKDGKPHRCQLNGIMVAVEITDAIPKLTGEICEYCGGGGTVGEARPTDYGAGDDLFHSTKGYPPTNRCPHCDGAGSWEVRK